MELRDKFDGLDGAVVSGLKVQVEYKHSRNKVVLDFRNHTDLNNWLYSKHVRGRLRVCQLLIKYSYEDDSI